MKPQPLPESPTQQASGQTLLIFDDEPHIRHRADHKLRKAGYLVHEASNGQDGLTLALEHRPNLIVTDFQMPILSGFEMSQQLADNEDTAGIPIILLTARGHKLTPSELATTGIRMVMDKPFGPSILLENVREHLL